MTYNPQVRRALRRATLTVLSVVAGMIFVLLAVLL